MTVRKSGYARKENDLHETEAWATEALLRRVEISGRSVWEPASGNHKMADVLRPFAARVITSDIKTYTRGHDFLYDFLSDKASLNVPIYDDIFTNPPYGPSGHLAAKFARRALRRCPGTVGLLLTAKFDAGKSRKDLFQDNPRFTAKITLTDRILWEGHGREGTEDHAWYIWTAHRPTEHPVIFYEGREPIAA